MRYFILVLSFISFSLFSWAQNHDKCSHKVSFQKTSLGDSLHVISYHIYIDSINWETDNLYARCELEVQSKVNNLVQIPLELMDLVVSEVKIDNVITEDFTQNNLRLNINLDAPLQENQSVNLSITYSGEPYNESWGGFYIDNQYAYNLGVGFEADPHNLGKAWFPCVDDFRDRAIYDITARVEDPLKAVAGGILQEVIDNGDGTHSYHWHLEENIPTYLASVAIGDYAIYEDTYEGINGDIPIQIYVRPYKIDIVEPTFTHLKNTLTAFETSWGAYPFERVGYVGTSIGAMEHATNIAYPSFAIDGGLSYEYLYTHELSHMWFGDKVTCASAEDMWLNEGWATYCQLFYEKAIYGEIPYKNTMRHHLREVLRTTHFTDGGYLALYGIPHNLTYGSTVYDKGATVVESLRGYLGDEVFFDAIKAYLNNYAYHHASSENMRDFLSNHTGVDMTDFFDAYVFTPGFSQFSVDSVSHISGNDYAIYMHQRIKGKETFANSNIIEVTLMDQQWNTHSVRVHFDGESGSETFTLPFEPVAAMADLNQKFSDATSDEYKIIKENGEYIYSDSYFRMEVEQISDSAFVRVSHNWVAPEPLNPVVEGLTLSDYRHYKIDGIFPEDFQATAVFTYSISSKLDHTLISNVMDSLVVLYRANASENWRGVSFERDGSPFVGYMRVPNMQKGEYTLALWDEQYVVLPEEPTSHPEDYLHIYPNPSTGKVFFEFVLENNALIQIFDGNGQQVDTISVQKQQTTAKWDGRRKTKGQYLVRLIDEYGKQLSQQKIILQ